jgi:2'-5' RNA ligase
MTSTQVNVFVSLRLPVELTEALVDVQSGYEDRIEPQCREHMHITLAYLAGVDAGRLADVAALISNGTWPVAPITLTGKIRHSSWELQKDPRYRHDPNTIQTREQIRLGIESCGELTAIRSRLLQSLGVPPGEYWPHVTLGLARQDMPTASVVPMPLPSGTVAVAGLELQQEITSTHFRVLARAALA